MAGLLETHSNVSECSLILFGWGECRFNGN